MRVVSLPCRGIPDMTMLRTDVEILMGVGGGRRGGVKGGGGGEKGSIK